ncbi:MAG TPA: hypothetical protein VMU59_14215 [Caulobacteraceae bacterium]|nr:hypothetical protein [Caulobacteraceae bacterium]
MTKRRPAFNPQQLGFDFETPAGVAGEGSLANLERKIASAVGRILKDDPRSRFEIAGGVSALLEDDVTKMMLDAYAAEAREGHNISFARMLALIAETQRFDILDSLLHLIGCKLVVGEEVLTVEMGHIQVLLDQLQERQRVLKKVAPAINLTRKRR